MPSKLIHFFCPACCAETAGDDRACPRCGADMEAVQRRREFVAKLIAALDHPEPETRARAAVANDGTLSGWPCRVVRPRRD